MGKNAEPRPSRPPLASMPDATAAVVAQVEQNQRAFQKQDCIFVGKKRVLGKAKKGIREQRYFKTVGLGIKTTKMKNTVIIRKDYLHYIKKYNRFEKRHKNT